MFHRKDTFVSIDGYDIVDGQFCILKDSKSCDAAAYKALGVDPDECILWVGLPIMNDEGKSFGYVGNIVFNAITGTVESIESDDGRTANALLGTREIPSNMIKGFRKGKGVALSLSGYEDATSDKPEDVVLGAILVSDEVEALNLEGGLAEKAGKGTAVVMDKAGKIGAKVSETAGAGAKVAGKAVNKGAYVTGRQIGRTKGMFSAFKDEYNKARHDDK